MQMWRKCGRRVPTPMNRVIPTKGREKADFSHTRKTRSWAQGNTGSWCRTRHARWNHPSRLYNGSMKMNSNLGGLQVECIKKTLSHTYSHTVSNWQCQGLYQTKPNPDLFYLYDFDFQDSCHYGGLNMLLTASVLEWEHSFSDMSLVWLVNGNKKGKRKIKKKGHDFS